MIQTTKSHFIKDGFIAGIPIFLGYFAAAIAFGLLAQEAGIPLVPGVGFSMLCFTGAAQFLMINLISSGVSPIEIIFTFCLVNFRYFLMSSSLQPRLKNSSLGVRLALAFGITDENYSVASLRKGILSPYFLGALAFVSWSGWVGGSLAGYLIGSVLPSSLQGAVGGSLYALFLSLLMPEIKKNILALAIAGFAGLLNTIFVVCLKISIGWGIVLSMVLTSALFTYIKLRKGN
ncbi:AzlC family ABC transporter permease [Spirochaeta cellobiosiphila]|uniref:AzlC family ABC transporter permease n=1 Tax=Spirochaeta cellobiosiphila TaxID=504483 RepID=UPI0003F68EFD|nr:AzlC family ABC transporter permease [Spirochaeta cellobiosiphila]